MIKWRPNIQVQRAYIYEHIIAVKIENLIYLNKLYNLGKTISIQSCKSNTRYNKYDEFEQYEL